QDDSYYLLKSYQEKYKNFRVINLRENVNFFQGKKLALALGIKSATNNTILLTDADCEPAGKSWIKSISNCFGQKTEIVLGYGGYKKYPGFLNMLIRYDTFFIAMQYMGFAKVGLPYMGVGRNLAYKKDLFFRSGGFTSHYKIKSGDDDLFINKVAKKNNTEICLQPDSFTFSEPEKNFSNWFKQKKRHLSTGSYYRLSHKFLLGTFAKANILFYLSFAAYLYFQQTSLTLYLSLGLFVLKMFFLMLLCRAAGKKLNEKKLFWVSPALDLTFAFLNPVFAVSNLFYKKNKWK
ncbi:MAG: glycosyltransferase, partial [Bacteroidota bacterium]